MKNNWISFSIIIGVLIVIIAGITLTAKYAGRSSSLAEANASGTPTSALSLPDTNNKLNGIPNDIIGDDQKQNQKQQQEELQGALEYEASASADLTSAKIVQITLTNGKSFKIAVYPDIAPIATENFLKKAQSNFYRGQLVFRVDKDQSGTPVLMQTGDPNNNGTGGGKMRAEYNQKPFLAGSVGVARGQNRDINNDSQFFITFVPVASLNGDYTNFGDVIEGLDVAQQIKIGQPIAKTAVLN